MPAPRSLPTKSQARECDLRDDGDLFAEINQSVTRLNSLVDVGLFLASSDYRQHLKTPEAYDAFVAARIAYYCGQVDRALAERVRLDAADSGSKPHVVAPRNQATGS
jgi:hypothetical protein